MAKSESYIVVNSGRVTSYVGEDATNLVRAMTIKHALKFYAATGMLVTRGATPTRLLQMASEYTGKKYKRGEHRKAAEDVAVWVETMRAALPVIKEN